MLVDALKRLVEGECVIDPTIASRLIHRPREPGALTLGPAVRFGVWMFSASHVRALVRSMKQGPIAFLAAAPSQAQERPEEHSRSFLCRALGPTPRARAEIFLQPRFDGHTWGEGAWPT